MACIRYSVWSEVLGIKNCWSLRWWFLWFFMFINSSMFIPNCGNDPMLTTYIISFTCVEATNYSIVLLIGNSTTVTRCWPAFALRLRRPPFEAEGLESQYPLCCAKSCNGNHTVDGERLEAFNVLMILCWVGSSWIRWLSKALILRILEFSQKNPNMITYGLHHISDRWFLILDPCDVIFMPCTLQLLRSLRLS